MVETIKYLRITWHSNNHYHTNNLVSKQNTLMVNYWHLEQGKISIHAVSKMAFGTRKDLHSRGLHKSYLLTNLLAEKELNRMKENIRGKTVAISAYLKGSVRKSEVMRSAEHKRSVKNGANSDRVTRNA